jgi:hypothetical protein
VRRLDGHIRCARRPIEREQAQADAGKYALQRRAAVHRVDISSASIPAISFVITAIIWARNHPASEVRSELPIAAVKGQIETGHSSFPRLIANHSQLQQRTQGMLLNGIA